MDNDVKLDSFLTQIKNNLNRDKIKLWLPPYITETTEVNEKELKILSDKYSEELKIPSDLCNISVKKIQEQALCKLKEKEYFRETGYATLKIRILAENEIVQNISIVLPLTSSLSEFQEKVIQEAGFINSKVKLIYQGKVLRDEGTLLSNGIKNSSSLMALVLNTDVSDLENVASRHKMIETTKEDAKLLAGRSTFDSCYLQVADQSGKPLNLPIEERKSLIVALSLHEKGRAALKKEDHSLALVLFLEADKEFRNCSSEILNSVDNYAVLNLDIAWCYLCLRSVNQLPDAEERLKVCEKKFHQSYGPNLERLMALKGTTGNESALFMRLHLLQAITFFHQSKRREASELLRRAENELQMLKVDDTSLCTLVELGFTAAEARLALRASHGNVPAAAEIINRKREEKIRLKRKEKEERKLNRKKKALGKCANGQWIEPEILEKLISMGFPWEASRQALQQTNNSISDSIQLIQDHPEMLALVAQINFRVSETLIERVMALGFDHKMARLALKKHKGDINAAVEELVANEGFMEWDSDDDSDDNSFAQKMDENTKAMEAYGRLSEDITTVEEDHLDLTLIPEEAFLKQYKNLLDQV